MGESGHGSRDPWAGGDVITMSEEPGGCELQALWGRAEPRSQEVSGEGEKQVKNKASNYDKELKLLWQEN